MEECDMTFGKIKEIIIDQLQADESSITLETHLMKDLEADSLDAVEIIMAIEDEFEIEVPDEAAEGFQTVGDIVKFVEEQKQ
jgi:acyl carrier protein